MFKISVMKYLLIITFVVLFGDKVLAQQYNLHIESCTDGMPISDVFIINRQGYEIGTTNKSGDCFINTKQFPVYLVKEGFDRKTLYDLSDSNVICMDKKMTALKEVNVEAKRMDLGKYLLSLRDKNLSWFIGKDTTLYYEFKYFWEVPGREWREQADGYISYNRRNIRSIFPPKISFIQYHYSENGHICDSFYNTAPVLGIDHLKFWDIMDNTGVSLWKRLINREPKGVVIPIPKFLLGKSLKHDLKDSSKENSQLYAYINRELILKNIEGKQIFSTFSDIDTSRINILEKVVFDKNDRLCSVEYFTPEQIANGAMPISESRREQDKPFSRINADSSYYYSKYVYSKQNPMMLVKAVHIDILVKDGVYYRTKTEMKLTDTIPQKELNLGIIYQTKGRDVLRSIQYSRRNNENSIDDDKLEQNLMNNPIIRKAIKEKDG